MRARWVWRKLHHAVRAIFLCPHILVIPGNYSILLVYFFYNSICSFDLLWSCLTIRQIKHSLHSLLLHFSRNHMNKFRLWYVVKIASTLDLPPTKGNHPHLPCTLLHIHPYPPRYLFGGYLAAGEHYCTSELCCFSVSLPTPITFSLYWIGVSDHIFPNWVTGLVHDALRVTALQRVLTRKSATCCAPTLISIDNVLQLLRHIKSL